LKKNNKGFTLAELLIVVAIIAVLVAIAIPVFTNQLEKSREATDASNIRAAYAEVAASALTDPEKPTSATITLKQQVNEWQSKDSLKDIAGVTITDITATKGGSVEVAYDGNGKITIGGKEVKSSFLAASTTP